MKNVTTHETSAALKAVGFPQPEPEAGQFWWFKGRTALGFRWQLRVAVKEYPSSIKFIAIDGEYGEMLSAVFAPTAADILREFEWLTFAGHHRSDFFDMATNPEDAAKAWLDLKKEKA